MLVQKPHPPITGYQLLLSVVVMTFGLAKAILAYAGKRTASTSVDWVLGVVLTLASVITS